MNPTLAQALKPMAPPQSEVHQALPVRDPVPIEIRREVDRILNLDRDKLRMMHQFPGEQNGQ